MKNHVVSPTGVFILAQYIPKKLTMHIEINYFKHSQNIDYVWQKKTTTSIKVLAHKLKSFSLDDFIKVRGWDYCMITDYRVIAENQFILLKAPYAVWSKSDHNIGSYKSKKERKKEW